MANCAECGGQAQDIRVRWCRLPGLGALIPLCGPCEWRLRGAWRWLDSSGGRAYVEAWKSFTRYARAEADARAVARLRRCREGGR